LIKINAMKKIFLTLCFLSVFNVKAQLVVDAPILEGLTSSLLTNQIDQKVDGYQTQLNTLNTAKNSLDTYEQIKKVNERIEEVSKAIQEFDDIKDIITISTNSYKQMRETLNYINKYTIKRGDDYSSVATQSVKSLQSSVKQLENIVTICQKFISSDMKMTDFERKTLLDEYKKNAQMEAYKISQMRKKYSFAVGINAL